MRCVDEVAETVHSKNQTFERSHLKVDWMINGAVLIGNDFDWAFFNHVPSKYVKKVSVVQTKAGTINNYTFFAL